MDLGKRKPSGREKDQASIRLLEKLRGQLHSSNSSAARQSASHLSWMQEDGLDILKEALFSGSARRTKSAAAYGLRKMRGRMKKKGLEVLSEGSKHSDGATAAACKNALSMLKKRPQAKPSFARKKRPAKFQIREVPAKRQKRKVSHKAPRPANRFSR
jgi:hypothetical protein